MTAITDPRAIFLRDQFLAKAGHETPLALDLACIHIVEMWKTQSYGLLRLGGETPFLPEEEEPDQLETHADE